jgi:hypothetical protein
MPELVPMGILSLAAHAHIISNLEIPDLAKLDDSPAQNPRVLVNVFYEANDLKLGLRGIERIDFGLRKSKWLTADVGDQFLLLPSGNARWRDISRIVNRILRKLALNSVDRNSFDGGVFVAGILKRNDDKFAVIGNWRKRLEANVGYRQSSTFASH